MNTGPALLEVHGLQVLHPLRSATGRNKGRITAVRDVSFDLHERRIFGLVGESGCGKTSLARAIIGLNVPAAGTVKYRQVDMRHMDTKALRQTRREIQFLFQDPLAALSPRRTIWQTLLEPLTLYRIGHRDSHKTRIEHVLHTVDLQNDVLNQYPHELSGGQRQRLVLARAVLAEPKLIIADEPMSSLDVSVQARMINLIRKLQQETGVAFLLISHNLAVIQQLADDVAIMYLGQVLESGSASQIFTRPAHPYTKALIEAVPGHHHNDSMSKPLSGDPPSLLTPPTGCVFHTRCPRVMENCFSETPVESNIAEISSGHHTVRCHLWNS